MAAAQLSESLLFLRRLWAFKYFKSPATHRIHLHKERRFGLGERSQITFLSFLSQSCVILSAMTSRRSRSTKATRPLLNVTSPKASPRLRSATVSNRSGWKHPKVASRFSALTSPRISPCLPPNRQTVFIIYRNAIILLSDPIVKPVIRVLSRECLNTGIRLFILQAVYF